jgi:MOSC domain-containing protein YiiM
MLEEAASVVAVSVDREHRFSKVNQPVIRLLAGLGVEGDAHLGITVQHQTRVRSDPTQPNLRQVHLLHVELFDELRAAGFPLTAGEIGENVTTRGIDLLGLPTGARLRLGPEAVVEITGLRNPCRQMNAHQQGLMQAVLDRDADGNLVRKAGVMGIVIAGGEVRPGDPIEVELPPEPRTPLAVV